MGDKNKYTVIWTFDYNGISQYSYVEAVEPQEITVNEVYEGLQNPLLGEAQKIDEMRCDEDYQEILASYLYENEGADIFHCIIPGHVEVWEI